MRTYGIQFRLATLFVVAGIGAGGSNWQPLSEDGLHDESNPSVEVLQEPAEALGVLKPDTAGNKVNWVESLRSGDIKPRATLGDDRAAEILELDILMQNTSPMAFVRFPHRAHTEWMACANCHEQLFVSKADGNEMNMGKILEGEYCGKCHGAVAFPLTECNRCHNADSNLTTGDKP